MTEEVVFENEEKLSRLEIAEKLRSIADGVEEGSVRLSSGSDSVEVMPAESSEFEVKVEREGNEISLELELEWKPGKSSGLEVG